MRLLGIDFGDRNTGLAISDELHLTAQPLETYRIKAVDEDNKRYFQDLVKRFEIGEIVLGYPLRMDGSEGTRAQKTKEFAAWLKNAVGIPIVLWDERLTTREAQNILQFQKIKRRNQRALEDQVSAAIILSSYLEQKNDTSHGPEGR